MAITATLSLLPRADGSATFKYGATTAIASVSGPMEVRPRDELPDKTFIEIIVRPAVGVGGTFFRSPPPSPPTDTHPPPTGTRERALESLLLSALSPLIIRTYHPRTLLQINLQIVEAADHTDATALLPVCINAATLALIDAGMPMKSVLVATTVFLDEAGEVAEEGKAGSRHVLGYTRAGECVFVESLGSFDERGFGNAVQWGMGECAMGDDEGMDVDGKGATVGMVVRRAVERKVAGDMRWKE